MAMRILASIILLFSVLFMPFWLSAILVFIGMLYFAFFWEAIILLFLSDLLYGAKEARFFYAVFISLIVSVIVLVIIEFVKKKIKFYPK